VQVHQEVEVLQPVLAEVPQGRPGRDGLLELVLDQAPDTMTCPPKAAPAIRAARFTSMPT
jgi:hypothetical protein